ncbi:MAG TPA: GNAT family N-acetyltransferase [Burkholderiaceae bacterium]
MTPAIRAARESDYPEMDALGTAALRINGAQVYAPDVLDAWIGMAHPQRFAKLAAQGVSYYVMTVKGEIVAYGGIDLAQERIEALFVAPACAADGLGERMLAHLKRQAQEHKLAGLSVESGLHAASFYHQHGFESYAQQVVKLAGGMQLEALLMRWSDA